MEGSPRHLQDMHYEVDIGLHFVLELPGGAHYVQSNFNCFKIKSRCKAGQIISVMQLLLTYLPFQVKVQDIKLLI